MFIHDPSIDRRFIIEGALNILVNQVKCPKMYDNCFCYSCKVKVKVEVNVNGFHPQATADDNQGTCFADGNVNAKDNVNVSDNQGTCFADGNGEAWPETHSDNDDDKYVSIFSETKQRDKTCSLCIRGGVSSVGGKPRGNSLSPIKGN